MAHLMHSAADITHSVADRMCSAADMMHGEADTMCDADNMIHGVSTRNLRVVQNWSNPKIIF